MKKRAAMAFAALAFTLGACSWGGNNFRDVEGVKSQNPDLVENFSNMDGHPNMGKVCIDGVAFMTTTRQYNSVERVPEWDKTCPGFTPSR